jgi:hypothetical protein
MLRQYLGTHKITFEKDKEAEENETTVPDRKAIQIYLQGLKSQRSTGSGLDDSEEEDGEEEDEEDDQEKILSPKKLTIVLKSVSATLYQVVCAMVLHMFDRKKLKMHSHRRKR